MMSAENLQRAVLSTRQFAVIDREAVPYRLYVYVACTVLAVVLNYVFGKETRAKGSLLLECGRRHGIYFARLTPAGP